VPTDCPRLDEADIPAACCSLRSVVRAWIGGRCADEEHTLIEMESLLHDTHLVEDRRATSQFSTGLMAGERPRQRRPFVEFFVLCKFTRTMAESRE